MWILLFSEVTLFEYNVSIILSPIVVIVSEYISLASLYDYGMKLPNFTCLLYKVDEQNTVLFSFSKLITKLMLSLAFKVHSQETISVPNSCRSWGFSDAYLFSVPSRHFTTCRTPPSCYEQG